MFCDLCTWGCLGEFFPSFPHVPVFYFVVSNTDLKWSQGPPISNSLHSLPGGQPHGKADEQRVVSWEWNWNIQKNLGSFQKSFSTRMPEILSLATLANLNLLDVINSQSLIKTIDHSSLKDAQLYRQFQRATKFQKTQPWDPRFTALALGRESC